MVERRRPANRRSRQGVPGKQGGQRPGRARRRSPPAPRGGGGPSPLVIVMIALPILGILGVIGYQASKDEPQVVVKDENEPLEELIDGVSSLEKEGHRVMTLLKNESSDARSAADAYRDRIDGWLTRWDELTRDMRDEEGRWKEEYAGYSEYRRRVTIVRHDFLKADPF